MKMLAVLMKQAVRATWFSACLVTDVPENILRKIAIFSHIVQVTNDGRDPFGDDINLVLVSWEGSPIEMVIQYDRDAACIFGNILEGVKKVLVGESTVAALCRQSPLSLTDKSHNADRTEEDAKVGE
jgi:hypothetical protein